ncbi:Uncharacterised protein [Mycobacteroides abscessus subsp. abscessus]|nr:Uncharacterised protein [Mycobacteroides abscessus subsp. abscessus]
MYFFGGQQWKTLRKVKTHLMSKHRTRTCSGTITFVATMVKNMLE